MTTIEPQEVSDVMMAFPASVSHLMPAWDDIPEGYKRGRSWANRFQSDWFFSGVESVNLPWKDDIDPETAMRHLRAIQGSFEPKHEHKEAAIAYLLDSWTDGEGTWTRRKT